MTPPHTHVHNRKPWSIGLWNARGLSTTTRAAIEIIPSHHLPNFLCITETHISPHSPPSHSRLANYAHIHQSFATASRPPGPHALIPTSTHHTTHTRTKPPLPKHQHRQPRAPSRPSGGVAIYSNVDIIRRHDIEQGISHADAKRMEFSQENIDIISAHHAPYQRPWLLWVECPNVPDSSSPSHTTTILLGVVYFRHDISGQRHATRPSDPKSVSPIIYASIDRARHSYFNPHGWPVLVVGDFNAHHDHWGSDKNDTRGIHLVDYCDAHSFTVLNAELACGIATYRSRKQTCDDNGDPILSHSILDLCITNRPDIFESLLVNPHTLPLAGLSDHLPLILSTLSHTHRSRSTSTNSRMREHKISGEAEPHSRRSDESGRERKERIRFVYENADWNKFSDVSIQLCTSARIRMQSIINTYDSPAMHTHTTTTTTTTTSIKEHQRAAEQLLDIVVGVCEGARRIAIPTKRCGGRKCREWWKYGKDLHQLQIIRHRKEKKWYRVSKLVKSGKYDGDRLAHLNDIANSRWMEFIDARNQFRNAVAVAKDEWWKSTIIAIESPCDQGEGYPQWKVLRTITPTTRPPLESIADKKGNAPGNATHGINNLAKHFASVSTLDPDPRDNELIRKCQESNHEYTYFAHHRTSTDLKNSEGKYDGIGIGNGNGGAFGARIDDLELAIDPKEWPLHRSEWRERINTIISTYPPNTVVGFTDGSSDAATRQAGAAGVAALPPRDGRPPPHRMQKLGDDDPNHHSQPGDRDKQSPSGSHWIRAGVPLGRATNNVAELHAIALLIQMVDEWYGHGQPQTHAHGPTPMPTSLPGYAPQLPLPSTTGTHFEDGHEHKPAPRAPSPSPSPPSAAAGDTKRSIPPVLPMASPPPPPPLLIFTDSMYVVGILNQGWRVRENRDLVDGIRHAIQQRRALGGEVHIKWVRGHAGVLGNECADALSRKAMSASNPTRPAPWHVVPLIQRLPYHKHGDDILAQPRSFGLNGSSTPPHHAHASNDIKGHDRENDAGPAPTRSRHAPPLAYERRVHGHDHSQLRRSVRVREAKTGPTTAIGADHETPAAAATDRGDAPVAFNALVDPSTDADIDGLLPQAEYTACSKTIDYGELNRPASITEMSRVFAIIRVDGAEGPDEFSPHLLRHAPPPLVELFTMLFNFTLRHHVHPSSFRRQNVVCIHKDEAPRHDPASYRPISLTSVIIKAFERLVLQRMWKAVGDRIVPSQAGFREEHTCGDHIYRLFSLIHQNTTAKAGPRGTPHYSVAFLDMSKAFDRTWHAGLLHKLHRIGIRGEVWEWVRALLTEREMRVVQDGLQSRWYAYNAGVPQGSVLSPFLFLVFINDIVDAVGDDADLLLFADDIGVAPKTKPTPHRDHDDDKRERKRRATDLVNKWIRENKARPPDERVQRTRSAWYERARRIIHGGGEYDLALCRALDSLSEWAKQWRVVWGVPKCGIVPFGTYRSFANHITLLPQFMLDGQQVPVVDRYKYLGVIFDRRTDWQAHTRYITTKANIVARRLTSLVRPSTPPRAPTMRTLVQMVLLPVITYGMHVWHATGRAAMALQATYIRPLRAVLGLPHTAHHHSILVECGVPNLLSLQHRSILGFMDGIRRRRRAHPMRSLIESHLAFAIHRNEHEWRLSPLSRTRLAAALSSFFTDDLNRAPANRKGMAAPLDTGESVAVAVDAKQMLPPSITTSSIDDLMPQLAKSGQHTLSSLSLYHSFDMWTTQREATQYRSLRMGDGTTTINVGMPRYLRMATKQAAILCTRLRFNRSKLGDSLRRRGVLDEDGETREGRCKRCNGRVPLDRNGNPSQPDYSYHGNDPNPPDTNEHFLLHCMGHGLPECRRRHTANIGTLSVNELLGVERSESERGRGEDAHDAEQRHRAAVGQTSKRTNGGKRRIRRMQGAMQYLHDLSSICQQYHPLSSI